MPGYRHGQRQRFWDRSCDPFEVAPTTTPVRRKQQVRLRQQPNLGVGGGLTCAAQATQSIPARPCAGRSPQHLRLLRLLHQNRSAGRCHRRKKESGSARWTPAPGQPSCTPGHAGRSGQVPPVHHRLFVLRLRSVTPVLLGDPPTKVFPPTCFQSLLTLTWRGQPGAGHDDGTGGSNVPPSSALTPDARPARRRLGL